MSTEPKHTIDELKMMQALPLNIKVRMTQNRIRQWVGEYGTDGVYISFSGGKDSTVLLHLVRDIYPEIKAVFVNTGLEYPEIQKFVKSFDNVAILVPKLRFPDVITKFGYPFISKEVAKNVFYARKGGKNSVHYRKLFGIGEYEDSRFSTKKYAPLINVDFLIASNCCDVMKKSPTHSYGHKFKTHPITAQMAAESQLRTQNWLKSGCNAFNNNNPISNPMSFWTEQDVLRFIRDNGIKIASVYGDVVIDGGDGYDYAESLICDCQYKTTGCDRTGCIFCGFGAHMDKGEGRFQRLKRTHPKQYDYCMGGGYYDSDGLWKPSKEGLGMSHCIDELNRIYGKDFIKY